MNYKHMTAVLFLSWIASGAYAQTDLGNVLGKIGSAIEKRYKEQTQKEKEIAEQNRKRDFYNQDGNLELDGIYYDCSPHLKEAKVTKGIMEIVRIVPDPERASGEKTVSEYSNQHEGLNNIYIPQSVAFVRRDKKGHIISTDRCKVIAMERGAFANSFAKSASITGNIKIIPEQAFMGSRIQSLTLNAGIEKIGYNAFASCANLSGVYFPGSVSELASYSFSDCTSLSSLSFSSESRAVISDGVFKGCSSLKCVVLPDNIASIGNYCFSECTNLSDVRLPENMSRLSEGLFLGCSSLFMLHIPPKVREIGNYLLGNSSVGKFQSHAVCIYLYSENPPNCSPETFDGLNPELCVVFVPENAIDTYRNTYGWSRFTQYCPLEKLSPATRKYYIAGKKPVVITVSAKRR